jgi:hypothetical protein
MKEGADGRGGAAQPAANAAGVSAVAKQRFATART